MGLLINKFLQYQIKPSVVTISVCIPPQFPTEKVQTFYFTNMFCGSYRQSYSRPITSDIIRVHLLSNNIFWVRLLKDISVCYSNIHKTTCKHQICCSCPFTPYYFLMCKLTDLLDILNGLCRKRLVLQTFLVLTLSFFSLLRGF